MKFVSTEHQIMGLITLNGALECVSKIVIAVQPVLGPILTVSQIVIAVGTAVWILRRARGAKLDNRIKEIEIEKLEKKTHHK